VLTLSKSASATVPGSPDATNGSSLVQIMKRNRHDVPYEHSTEIMGGEALQQVIEILKQYWGYDDFLPLQREAI